MHNKLKNHPTIEIDKCVIAPNMPPYVIAELSANHNGKITNALELIMEAKKAGAHAIKLQTYTADSITMNCDSEDFKITDGLWKGKSLYQLYQDAHTPWEWHKTLFDYAKKVGISIFSSPFDDKAVDFLEDLNCPLYKIASFEAVDLRLIKYAASTGKPLIISTGMANALEIDEAICAAKDVGCKQIAIMHCVSGYPAPASDYNLRTIPDMISRWGLVVGLSDHTLSNATAVASVAMGASIIEKHLTLNRNGGGADDSFSLEPKDLKQLCCDVRVAWESMGEISYERKSSELQNIKFRRSLYFNRDLIKGDLITQDSIRSIRPGFGLAPSLFDSLIGKKIKIAVTKGTAVNKDHFD